VFHAKRSILMIGTGAMLIAIKNATQSDRLCKIQEQ